MSERQTREIAVTRAWLEQFEDMLQPDERFVTSQADRPTGFLCLDTPDGKRLLFVPESRPTGAHNEWWHFPGRTPE